VRDRSVAKEVLDETPKAVLKQNPTRGKIKLSASPKFHADLKPNSAYTMTMAGKIPQSFIDELLVRTDVVDIIDSRVSLKKKGKDYMACCPFHGEKTPSFSVSREKQFYYCFGCGASGSALSFLMDYEHLGFVEAIEMLASQAGLEVPREEGGDNRPRVNYEPLYKQLEASSQFYRDQLRHHPQAQRAIDYLKNRGLSGEIVKAFGIGFAPAGWDNLIKHVGDDPVAQQALTTSGMVIEKEEDNKRYDRFRDRIMIPILDKRGRVIAFGGRVLDGDSQGAKYLNSPETPIFHKGRELYGLYQARKALRDIPRLLVVEGYMDVIALAQFGVRYAVATLGTATTTEHLEQLFRATDEVVFCFDGDRAGRAAAERALKNALPVIREGREAKFLFLPDGEDPDSLIRSEGQTNFETRVKKSIPLSQFLLENLCNQADIQSIDGRARLLELARPLFTKFSPGIYRDLITDQLAKLAEMDSEKLSGHLYKQESTPNSDTEAPIQRKPAHVATKRNSDNQILGRIIQRLLHMPSLAMLAGEPSELLASGEPGVKILVELLTLLQAQPELNTASIIEHWRDTPTGSRMAELAGKKLDIQDEDILRDEFRDLLLKLQQQGQKRELQARHEQIANKPHSQLTEDEKKLFSNQTLTGEAPK